MGEITELVTARTITKHNRNTLFPWENDKRGHKNNTEKNSFVTLVRARLHKGCGHTTELNRYLASKSRLSSNHDLANNRDLIYF